MTFLFRMKSAVVAIVIALLVTGCMQPVSYIDPAYGKVGYADLTRRSVPYEWRLAAEFQRRGTRYPAADLEVLGHVDRVIRASGMAVPTAAPGAPELKVTINNVPGPGDPVAKGIVTGLTLGLIGGQVTDRYEMEAVLSDGETVIRRSGYRHALHSTIGNAGAPSGAAPMSTSAAFAGVVEQLLLNALKDLEKECAGVARCAGSKPAS